MDVYDQFADLLKAMAHPERLRLLTALRNGEECVCHLTALLGERQPYVSQQLAYLREAKLIGERKVGLRVYYRITDARVLPLLNALKTRDQTAPRRLVSCACPRCNSKKNRKEQLC
jgi:ArsR family transcriptional regulator